MVEGKDCNAGSDKSDDNVFVERVRTAEEGDLQEHDREKLTGLGEDEGNVVDMRERGISEWGSEGGGDGDE